jgi:hypothetical protein
MAVQLGIEYDPAPALPRGLSGNAPGPIVTFLRENRDMVVQL